MARLQGVHPQRRPFCRRPRARCAPSVKPEVIMISYAQGTSVAKIMKLEDEAEEVVGKLARDVDLFGEEGNNTQ